MAFDCPFSFYIKAKATYCWVFIAAAVVVFAVGAGLFVYAFLNAPSMQETQFDLLLKVAGGCVTVVAVWLFKEAYKHFQPVHYLNSVCSRLGALNAPPASPEKAEQIKILTDNAWSICNEP